MIDVTRDWQVLLTVVALLMTRMLVAFSVIPLFVGTSIPAIIRAAFVAGLSLSLLPMALDDESLKGVATSALALYAAKEAAIGLVLGLLASAGFWALYMAGTVIEQQAGLAFATTIDPLSGQDDSLVGTLLMRLFTVLFLVAGGLLSLIGLLFDSYKLWPISKLTPAVGTPEVAALVMRALGEMVVLAIKISVPFVILMLLVELALGLLSRFAPQLNVFFVALPLKVLVLVVLLLLYSFVFAGSDEWMATVSLRGLLESLRGTLR